MAEGVCFRMTGCSVIQCRFSDNKGYGMIVNNES
jgi:hypothetical protein